MGRTRAAAAGSPGILFFFQANPAFEEPPGSPAREGFDEVIASLVDGAAIPNVTRVETFGDRDYHWLRLVVDPNSEGVFAVHQEIVGAND
jgi:hypothetical protein